MIHSFDEDLEFSQIRNGRLDHIYHKYFQNISEISQIERTDDMKRQRAGVDTIITLQSGEVIVTQEKYRRREFTGDFLIEYVSVFDDGHETPGWIYTIDADYLFTVYAPSQMVKIYPVVQLKIAWSNNYIGWKANHFITKARNHRTGINWVTYGVAVPTDILEVEITKAMRFDYQQTLL